MIDNRILYPTSVQAVKCHDAHKVYHMQFNEIYDLSTRMSIDFSFMLLSSYHLIVKSQSVMLIHLTQQKIHFTFISARFCHVVDAIKVPGLRNQHQIRRCHTENMTIAPLQ